MGNETEIIKALDDRYCLKGEAVPGEQGPPGLGITSIKAVGNTVILTWTDGRETEVQIPLGPAGVGIKGITRSGDLLIFTMTDDSTCSVPFPSGSGGSTASLIPALKPTGSAAQDTANLKAAEGSVPIVDMVPKACYYWNESELSSLLVHGWGVKRNDIRLTGTLQVSGVANIQGATMYWTGNTGVCLHHLLTGGVRMANLHNQFDDLVLDNQSPAVGTLLQVEGQSGVIQNVRYGAMNMRRAKKGLMGTAKITQAGVAAWVNEVEFDWLTMWACAEFIEMVGVGCETAGNRLRHVVLQPDKNLVKLVYGIRVGNGSSYIRVDRYMPWDWANNNNSGDPNNKLIIESGVNRCFVHGLLNGNWVDKNGGYISPFPGLTRTAGRNVIWDQAL